MNSPVSPALVYNWCTTGCTRQLDGHRGPARESWTRTSGKTFSRWLGGHAGYCRDPLSLLSIGTSGADRVYRGFLGVLGRPLRGAVIRRETVLRYLGVIREAPFLLLFGEAVDDAPLDVHRLPPCHQPPLERHGVGPLDEVRHRLAELVSAHRVHAFLDVDVVAGLPAHIALRKHKAASADHMKKAVAESHAWVTAPWFWATTSKDQVRKFVGLILRTPSCTRAGPAPVLLSPRGHLLWPERQPRASPTRSTNSSASSRWSSGSPHSCLQCSKASSSCGVASRKASGWSTSPLGSTPVRWMRASASRSSSVLSNLRTLIGSGG